MLSVANKPFMPSVFMLNVVIQSVIMLNVVAPFASPIWPRKNKLECSSLASFTSGQCYKTLYGRELRLFTIS